MTRYLDISLNRAWRLNLVVSETDEQQSPPEPERPTVINTVTNEVTVQRAHGEPVVTAPVHPVHYNFAFYAEPAEPAEPAVATAPAKPAVPVAPAA